MPAEDRRGPGALCARSSRQSRVPAEETLPASPRSESPGSALGTAAVTLIGGRAHTSRSHLRELWQSREIIFILAWRDIKVRYKQTFIGIAWAILQPLLTMVVFTIIFGKFASFDSQGLPYQVFVYSGLVPWTFFAAGFSMAAMSVVSNRNLVGKVYFPRLALPLSAVVVPAVDFFFSFAVLFGIMAWFHIVPEATAPLSLLFVLALAVTAFGAGCVLATLNVRYRDVPYVVPFLIQTWLYLSPVIYATASLPAKWQWVFSLNPVVFAITGFRWALLGTPPPSSQQIVLGLASLIAMTATGLFVFRRFESRFADTL